MVIGTRNNTLRGVHTPSSVLVYTIGWTYTNLTCHPSVFIIQGYADRDDIPDNPSLNLTSTSSVFTFPTNITNGSLYWRLLAHDMAGSGVGCVPIPVGPRHDYSSLEVVWPERRGKWKSRIWKNPDANTETETNPEVDCLTGSATGSDPGSVLFYFLFIFYYYFSYFLLLPIA